MDAERRPCPVCGGGRFRSAFRADGRDYERCVACGFERMQDPPEATDLDAYYAAERAQGEELWREHDRNLLKYGAVLAHLERRRRPGRMLDVGCSVGTTMVAARARGWEVSGIELSVPVADFGRAEWELDIRTRPLADEAFPDRHFDLVWMNHTLEHLLDPDHVLAECRRVLAPGGILYQALPNHGSLKSRLLGPCWSYGITPEHVSLFSSRTLRLLVQRTGFRVVEQWTASFREDPRLLFDTMRRLGRLEQLMRWCGKPNGEFDQGAYIRFITDRRLPNWISNRMWPARLVGAFGLGEEAHLVAVRA